MTAIIDIGDVVRLTHFEHHANPDARFTFRIQDKKKLYVMVLLGVENRDGTEPLDTKQVFRDLGWKEK